jgi:hypothetical protein
LLGLLALIAYLPVGHPKIVDSVHSKVDTSIASTYDEYGDGAIRLIVDAALSPDLLGFVARQHGLFAIGSLREPGIIYKTQDPLTNEIQWRNKPNRFGAALLIVNAENDVRFVRLLDSTEATVERVVLVLIPYRMTLDKIESCLVAEGVPDGSKAYLGFHLLDPCGFTLAKVTAFRRRSD